MRSGIFLKLFAGMLLVIAAATVTLDIVVRRAWEASLRRQIALSLTQKVELFADRLGSVHNSDLEAIVRQVAHAAGARATVIAQSGVVLADSEANPQHMENHAMRPEFRAALAGHVGSDTRRSRTVGIEFLYIAVPIRGGGVRLAYPLAEIRQMNADVRRALIQSSALALILAALLAGIAAHLVARRLQRIVRFAERIADGELSARVAENSTDEIAQVAAALDRTARTLESNFVDLQRSRAELEAVLNSMYDAVIAIAADRRVLWSNGAAGRLLENAPTQGAALVEIIRAPEAGPAVAAALQDEIRSVTIRSAIPGHTFRLTAAPMPDHGAVLVLHDISDVERLEKTRRDFVANVSHELRTPLTSIQGYVETLLDSPTAETTRQEFLQIIRSNALRMSRLTEDLLTLARVESGEQKLATAPASASEILRETAANLTDLAKQRGIALEIDSSPDVEVLADRDAVQQVFNNLIENALNYASSGRRIVMGAAEANGSVEFYVRDFGPGIASEHLPRLFERFYRVDKARSRETGGTGLGLAIVKHIILNHGGIVRAESQLGHGTTFRFTLPLAQPNSHDIHSPVTLL